MTTDDLHTELALLRQATQGLNETIQRLEKVISDKQEDHETRLRVIEKQQAQLAERLTLWQLGQMAFTTTIGAMVAFIKR